jgi:hypothetical protein
MSRTYRKTIDVLTVKANVNHALAVESPGNTRDYRIGLCAVLEDVLHATGNYRGYCYTDPAVRATENLTPEGYLKLDAVYDDTRRCYY